MTNGAATINSAISIVRIGSMMQKRMNLITEQFPHERELL